MKLHQSARLIKSEDLNHHGTLFAGRMAEWFVEGGFVAAAVAVGNPDNIVCLKVHGMRFNIPAQKGDILEITAKVVDAGTTSLTVYNQTLSTKTGKVLVEGFITFVNVDSNGNKMPHGLVLENLTDEELELQKRARELK
ncbi:acyl-CoA thioesterase [Vallitalea okinawensis]|uniref:acyl-CoA thioesterase n=1 Tax=Vallitalea okinawensis TaxID=2078660 RepID=UPI000CFBC3CE|nr:hotdog domain-containing protein [Vallitalea okinawensis]